MSRAIPAGFNEYLLDRQSQNTGVVCNGQIMPVRNSPDPASLQFQKCLRGEDVMFLKEAVAARRNDLANTGLDDLALKSSRLVELQQSLGDLCQSEWWSRTDPFPRLSANVYTQMPIGWYDWEREAVKAAMDRPASVSQQDQYAVLDHVPVLHLFRDVQQLAYTVLQPYYEDSSYSGYGIGRTTAIRRIQTWTPQSGYEIRDETYNQYAQVWHDEEFHRWTEQGELQWAVATRQLSSQETWTEQYGYRQFHRYLEVMPCCCFEVINYFATNVSTQVDQRKYVFAPYPASTWFDVESSTSVVAKYQGQALEDWATAIFNKAGMQKYARNIDGSASGALTRQRYASILYNAPYFWIARFAYCALDRLPVIGQNGGN